MGETGILSSVYRALRTAGSTFVIEFLVLLQPKKSLLLIITVSEGNDGTRAVE